MDACEKLDLSAGQKKQICAMLKETSAEDGKNYTIALPAGLSYTVATLTQIPSTGISNVVFGAFAVMSFLSGQFFLFQINRELEKINKNLYKIINFLDNAKESELKAYFKVTQNAYKNYAYIMSNEPQRNATIGSLQRARVVAIGNINFYLNDLVSIPGGKQQEIEDACKQAFVRKECLYLSFQIYAMSWILEVYYAQNFEPKYIENVKEDIINNIYGHRDAIRDTFKALSQRLEDAKNQQFTGRTREERSKIHTAFKKQVADIICSLDLQKGDWLSSLADSVSSSSGAVSRKRNYYLSNGEVYTEKLAE